MNNLFYRHADKTLGPISLDELGQIIAAGQPGMEYLVRQGEGQVWQQIKSVEELKPVAELVKTAPEPFAWYELFEKMLTLLLIVLLTANVVAKVLASLNSFKESFAITSGGLLDNLLRIPLHFLFLSLVGVGVYSLRCIAWLRTQPFRAVAVGRFLFAYYLVVYPIIAAIECPRYKVEEVPEEKTQATPWIPPPVQGGDGLTHVPPELLGNAPSKKMIPTIQEFTSLDRVGYGWKVVKESIGNLALCLSFWGLYRRKLGNRPSYDLGHFVGDITFGKLGDKYPWNADPTSATT